MDLEKRYGPDSWKFSAGERNMEADIGLDHY
jgi:hypothetical protein